MLSVASSEPRMSDNLSSTVRLKFAKILQFLFFVKYDLPVQLISYIHYIHEIIFDDIYFILIYLKI